MKSVFFSFSLLIAGCGSVGTYVPNTNELERGALPPANKTVVINNLSNCTDSSDKSISIDTNSPLTILVHGCKSSAGHFRALAQLYAFHGQQAICYSYDDRKSLIKGADNLTKAINDLSKVTQNEQPITVIGHSMGGLVARKAFEENGTRTKLVNGVPLDLITVSAPVSGISAADTCGKVPLQWLSVGIVPGICWLITGSNWKEITSNSTFIQHPKPLLPAVDKYLKIVTNESNTCRKSNANGQCIESDFVFNLEEQYHPVIDNYNNVQGIEVKAGHVEIVGNKDIIPRKLLNILQQNGALSLTPSNRITELEQLLADLY